MGHDHDSERGRDALDRGAGAAARRRDRHGHAHGHGKGRDDGHGHGHDHGAAASSRRLTITLGLVVVYMLAEVVGGLASNSLALLADAGHMLSDAGALALSLLAMRIARRPPSTTHTFGYQRAEILAAMVNGAMLFAISAYVFYAAYRRIGDPAVVEGGLMMAVAVGGLAINLAGLWILRGGRGASLNMHGAWLHVLSDALGSIGAIIAAFCVQQFGWNWADPAASVVIGVLVVYSAWSLVRSTARVLMQAVPAHIDIAAVHDALISIGGVREIHDLHVWSVTSGRDVVSAHVTTDDAVDRDAVMAEVQRRLRDRFDLRHSTIQLDVDSALCDPCPPPISLGPAA
ncbi:MAG TPA: cation diffusion facilitator family transporter [Kofleriaceae bacterium]|nr:cation diffusion facilitator family transporter [Kofleriaceae bacterium]